MASFDPNLVPDTAGAAAAASTAIPPDVVGGNPHLTRATAVGQGAPEHPMNTNMFEQGPRLQSQSDVGNHGQNSGNAGQQTQQSQATTSERLMEALVQTQQM